MSAQCFGREDCTVEPGIEIEERLLELIRLVDMLELALEDEALGTARRQLRELDATSAMDVLKLLDQTAKSWAISTDPVAAGPKLGAVRVAERMLRDIVVMFLVNRGGADAAGDRQVVLETAESINGTPLDRELRAKHLLAYHKLKQHRRGIWLGEGATDDPRVGDPERRRRRRERVAGGG